MKLRALTLGGAALASLLLLSPSAFAEYYNTNPTPSERAATDRLNSAAAVRAQGDANADAAARARFEADQSRYENDRARIDAERAAYERDRNAHRGRFDPARRWDVFYGHNGFRAVEAMRPRELMGLRVNTRGGGRIGMIRDVDTNGGGRITRIAISVGGGLAWVDTDDLRFDPAARVVYTTLSRDQVNTMARLRYPRF